MIRRRFDYVAPKTLAEAAGEMGEGTFVLGGGTVLVPLMTLGELAPRRVIDTRHLPIRQVRRLGRDLEIGAAASYQAVGTALEARRLAPLLGLVCAGITGGPQLTGQATFGGAACYGNPASEAPGCLVALSARLVLVSAGEERTVQAADFFLGAFETARRADELLSCMILPDPALWVRSAYVKQKHCTSSWPIVTASALADEAGLIRVTIGAAGVRPCTVELKAGGMDDAGRTAGLVGEAVADTLTDSWTDALADGTYRRRVAPALAARVVRKLLNEAPS